MPIENWTDVIEKDFPNPEITREMVTAPTRKALLLYGNTRLISPRLSTTAQLEERRNQAYQPL